MYLAEKAEQMLYFLKLALTIFTENWRVLYSTETTKRETSLFSAFSSGDYFPSLWYTTKLSQEQDYTEQQNTGYDQVSW